MSYFLSPSCTSESSSNKPPSKGPDGVVVVSTAVPPNTSTNMLTSLGAGCEIGDTLLTIRDTYSRVKACPLYNGHFGFKIFLAYDADLW